MAVWQEANTRHERTSGESNRWVDLLLLIEAARVIPLITAHISGRGGTRFEGRSTVGVWWLLESVGFVDKCKLGESTEMVKGQLSSAQSGPVACYCSGSLFFRPLVRHPGLSPLGIGSLESFR